MKSYINIYILLVLILLLIFIPYNVTENLSDSACIPSDKDPTDSCSINTMNKCCDGLTLSYKTGDSSLKCTSTTPLNPTCSSHIDYVKGNLDKYPGTGLTSSNDVIQQYLYKCEQNICPANSQYGDNLPPGVTCLNPQSNCPAITQTCKDHLNWMKQNINALQNTTYAGTGLSPSTPDNDIQQYLYKCEQNVCPCNNQYGDNLPPGISCPKCGPITTDCQNRLNWMVKNLPNLYNTTYKGTGLKGNEQVAEIQQYLYKCENNCACNDKYGNSLPPGITCKQ